MDRTASDFRCNLSRDHHRDRLALLLAGIVISDEALESLSASLPPTAREQPSRIKLFKQDFGRRVLAKHFHGKKHVCSSGCAMPNHFRRRERLPMQHVSLTSFCQRTGLTAEDVKKYEEHGIIHSTTKGTNRFYSLSEVYRIKGILYLIRTKGLSPEEAARTFDKDSMSTNPS